MPRLSTFDPSASRLRLLAVAMAA
eukprot:SAG22_NODE_14532_length_372_cov_0.802198_1_plen_23_part_01